MRTVPFGTAVRAWFLISLQTFGGPAGQIAVMHRALVDDRRWIGERRFLHALNYCMLLPGPEAQQLAVYTGWLLHGTRGGLVAGTLFVLPGAVALLVLSAIYVAFGSTVVVTSLFAGLAPAVLAVVAQAVVRVGRRALVRPALVVLAVVAFLALTLLAVPFPLVVLAAAAAGWALGRWRPVPEPPGRATSDAHAEAPVLPDDALYTVAPSRSRALTVLGIGVVAWGVPLLAVVLLTGRGSVLTTMGVFFSGAAVVTFGGAYAVLAYVAQRAVEVYGWLSPTEMLRGLALAETTPGPRGNHTLAAALTGVTAAVVGVIASLAVYFASTTLFTRSDSWGLLALPIPELASVRWFALAVTALAAGLLFRLRWGVLSTLGLCAAVGLVGGLLGVPVT